MTDDQSRTNKEKTIQYILYKIKFTTQHTVRTFGKDISIDLLQSSTDQCGFDQFLGRRGGCGCCHHNNEDINTRIVQMNQVLLDVVFVLFLR